MEEKKNILCLTVCMESDFIHPSSPTMKHCSVFVYRDTLDLFAEHPSPSWISLFHLLNSNLQLPPSCLDLRESLMRYPSLAPSVLLFKTLQAGVILENVMLSLAWSFFCWEAVEKVVIKMTFTHTHLHLAEKGQEPMSRQQYTVQAPKEKPSTSGQEAFRHGSECWMEKQKRNCESIYFLNSLTETVFRTLKIMDF